ncbi:RnfH family protein [Noviherbaspirillum sp.]|uniref:RnfH family protein n=1 Tax=Noviherbaspirillum sp. TaxID=1926288 RepID=UPI002D461C15|nr:RnfH family protein [Noviherbaspirillum sp.]HZW22610.1 RnfH family protein [Noviherbaspirillum sp.]
MAEIAVQVCYARPDLQILRDLKVEEGTTIRTAIEQSGLLNEVREIDLAQCRVGVFGKLRELDSVLRERERIEIYRSLIADPKESRRKRAEKKESKAR